MYNEHRLELFACRASKDFTLKVVEEMNKLKGSDEPELKLGALEVTPFSDGEFQPSYTDSVRGATVFILQSTFPPTENLMELLLSIDAAKRASADRVMTCDLHADQIQGFFDFPVDHIYASKVFIPYLQSLNLDNLAIAAPDMGGAKRAHAYAKELACPVIICHKSRERANVVASITAIGEVEGKNVVIVDDMIDTAGTLTKASEVLMEKGAKSVRACATHPILSGPAYERLAASPLKEIIVSDSIPITNDPTKDTSKIKVVSLAGTFAKIIKKVHNFESVSTEFIF